MSYDIHPKMKILNMVISILVHFCSFISIWALQATLIRMSSNEMWWFNDVKLFPTVYHRIYCCNFWRYPIRCCVTKSSALEIICAWLKDVLSTTMKVIVLPNYLTLFEFDSRYRISQSYNIAFLIHITCNLFWICSYSHTSLRHNVNALKKQLES